MSIDTKKIHPASINKKKMRGGEMEDIIENETLGNKKIYYGSLGLLIGQLGAIIYYFIK